MNAIGVVFAAEVMRRLRSRAFIFATAVGALGVVLVIMLPSLITGSFGGNAYRIVLAGDPALTAAARPLLQRDFEVYATLRGVSGTPDADFLSAHGKSAAVALFARDAHGLRVTVYARDPSLFSGSFTRDLAPLQIALATGGSASDVARHLPLPVTVHDIGGRFTSASSAAFAKGIAFLFIFVLYIGILLNAQSIMASVAEEKTSRIAELLVASIDPARLLTAKILASASTGLIQLAVWIAAGSLAGNAAASIFSDSSVASAPFDLGPVALPTGEVLAFVAFFLVGLVQYAVLYAAAASLINRTEDLGSVAGPLVIPVVFGFVLAQIAVASPNAPNVMVTSELPLLAPFVMFTRIAVGAVPAWQILLSLAINIAAAGLLALFAGRVYRVGLLLYGRPPSLRQVLATLVASR